MTLDPHYSLFVIQSSIRGDEKPDYSNLVSTLKANNDVFISNEFPTLENRFEKHTIFLISKVVTFRELKNNEKIQRMVYNGRHYNCQLVMTVTALDEVPPSLKQNCRIFYLK